MKAAIEREESRACTIYPEREQARAKLNETLRFMADRPAEEMGARGDQHICFGR